MLLAAGSLASLGRMNLIAPVTMALAACFMADFFWYEIGRRRRYGLLRKCSQMAIGSRDRINRVMAKMSPPGFGAVLLAKFLPGPNLVSPMAGLTGLKRTRFLVFDSIASTVWVSGYISVGYIFSNRLEVIAANGSRVRLSLLAVVTCVLAAIAVVRSVRRRCPKWGREAPQLSA